MSTERATSLPVTGRFVLAVSIAGFVVQSAWSAELPSPEKLIEEALALHAEMKKKDGDDNWIVLCSIAKAQTYVGRFEDAIDLARSQDDFTRAIMFSLAVDAQAEVTGRAPAFPKDFQNAESELAHTELAKFHATRREFDLAFQQLAAVRVNRGSASAIADGYIFVANAQLASGKRDAALSTFRKAIGTAKRMQFVPHRVERLLAVVQGTLQAGDRKLAKETADSMQQAAAKHDRQLATPSLFQVKGWARVGKAWRLLGDVEAAKQAFGHALKLSESVGEEDREFSADLPLGYRVDALTEIGVMQFGPGFQADAAASFAKAVQVAEQLQERFSTEVALTEIVEARFEAGDESGARDTARQVDAPYWQALCFIKLSNAGFRKKQSAAAHHDLQRAVELAKRIKKRDNQVDVNVKLGSLFAISGDIQRARKTLSGVLAISNTTKGKRFHQWIAFAQVGQGLLDDAYRTIGEIPQRRYRMIPMAKLAARAAQEAFKNRKKVKSPSGIDDKR